MGRAAGPAGATRSTGTPSTTLAADTPFAARVRILGHGA